MQKRQTQINEMIESVSIFDSIFLRVKMLLQQNLYSFGSIRIANCCGSCCNRIAKIQGNKLKDFIFWHKLILTFTMKSNNKQLCAG